MSLNKWSINGREKPSVCGCLKDLTGDGTTVQVSRLEEELSMKNKALAVLEERLTSQQDYEEIKRELG